MNESIFRSPKWLRNFIDFEVNTGGDIKGEPSESQKRKNILKEWDARWKETPISQFKDFFSDIYQVVVKNDYNGYLLSSDVEEIRKRYQGDMSIWEKYDKWIEDRKRKEREKERERIEQDRLRKIIDDLYNALFDDFKKSPYSDKIKWVTIKATIRITYRFENNKVFQMQDEWIDYDGDSYNLGIVSRNKFTRLMNDMIKFSRKRPTEQSSNNNNNNNNRTNYKSKSSNPYADHPKGGIYQTLKDTIKLRKEQLSKLSKDDPERRVLENELSAAERAFNNLKKKYQFENIVNYSYFLHSSSPI